MDTDLVSTMGNGGSLVRPGCFPQGSWLPCSAALHKQAVPAPPSYSPGQLHKNDTALPAAIFLITGIVSAAIGL